MSWEKRLFKPKEVAKEPFLQEILEARSRIPSAGQPVLLFEGRLQALRASKSL